MTARNTRPIPLISEFKPERWTRTIRIFALVSALILTAVLAVSLFWNLDQQEKLIYETARVMARTTFEKDVLYRRWNSSYGGVYVPVTEKSQPNPYLNGRPEQNLTSTEGKQYTLINPAYMTRQVFELQRDSMGILGHITSLNPIRPANAADAWETHALEAFETGTVEVSSVEMMNGQEYLRLMRPLKVEQGCLKCHAQQGYVAGQVRGGISESVPIAMLRETHALQRSGLIIGHVTVWILGWTSILIATLLLQRSFKSTQKAEEKVLQMSQHDALTGLFNRAYFEEFLRTVGDSRDQPFVVVSVDVDGLKRVNDTLGHAAGDELLKGAADVLRSSFRTGDVVARTGGDEFVVLLPNQDEGAIPIVLQRVEKSLKDWNQAHPGINLQFSIGAAAALPPRRLEEVLKLADQRMYDNKAEHKAAERRQAD
ncbi:MAG TPA: diguanylate cyclase [Anaerolineaceae bacterium]|nr:diguanylate cyclase [Anaerolineaceae bacterium]HPN53113.1 diguanylate cyclase [Anaerolineaceae bacterium]